MKELLKKHQYFFEVIFILIVGLIPLLWYKSEVLGLGHDMGFPLAPIDYFQDRLFSWTNRVGAFGSNQTESLAGFFIHGLEALVASLGFSLLHTQQIVFIFWFTLPGITMYLLLKSLHPEKEDFIIRLSGSLFYMMNHYLLQAWMIAERTKFSIVAAMPLIVLFIINVIYKRQSIFKNSILLSFVLLFLNGGAGIPLWGGLAVSVIITLIVMFAFSEEPFRAKLIRSGGFLALSFTLVFLTNLYWTYPYLKSFNQNYTVRADASGGGEGAANWSAEISKYASFTNIIKMQGIPDWYNNPENPYSNNFLNNYFLIFLSIVFPLVAFAGLVKKPNETRAQCIYKINFLLILLLSIPLTAGSHPPTGILYDFALKHVPGFLIFRTPFLKFGMLIWFAYAYFVAIGLKNIVELVYPRLPNALSKLSSSAVYIPVFIIFVILLSIYNYPFFTGSFFDWSSKYSTRVNVPDYIFESKKELDSNHFTTRTLLLPYLDNRVKTDSYSWRYYSLSHLSSIFSRRPTVLNDVTLQGSEGAVVNGIYEQLENTGKSNLLAYTGVDRVIIRNDFLSPQSANYTTSVVKSAITGKEQFLQTKQIGEWNYFNVAQEETKPLVYSPKSIANFLINTSHLSTALDFPEIPSLADALVLSDELNPAVQPEKAYQYIVEGLCTNCKRKLNADPLDLKLPRILPGTKLDFLIKLVEKFRINRLTDPAQRIDFILGTMAKNAAAVNLLITNAKNAQTVEETIQGWNLSLEELKTYYLSMKEDDKKRQSSERIYRYLWSFILKSAEWRVVAGSGDNVSQLMAFDDSIRSYISELGLQPPTYENIEEKKMGKYQLVIPRNGIYKIGIYTNLIEEMVQEDSSEKKTLSLNIALNNQNLDLKKSKEMGQWFETPELFLKEGDNFIDVPAIPSRKISYKDISLKALSAQTGCHNIDLNDARQGSSYKITFSYSSAQGKSLAVNLIEKDMEMNKLVQTKIRPFVSKIMGGADLYRNEFFYEPGKFTKSATIQLCVDADYHNKAEVLISNLEIEESFSKPLVFAYSLDQFNQLPSSKIEFVALNQTKYLISAEVLPDNFLLVFNARTDGNWKLREVDAIKAEKYFQGNKKEYLNGRVVEYQGREDHIISNLAFPIIESSGIIPASFTINGFGNSWDMDLKDTYGSSSKKVYLLEYDVQNDVYVAAAVSTFVFISLIILYVILNQYGKNK